MSFAVFPSLQFIWSPNSNKYIFFNVTKNTLSIFLHPDYVTTFQIFHHFPSLHPADRRPEGLCSLSFSLFLSVSSSYHNYFLFSHSSALCLSHLTATVCLWRPYRTSQRAWLQNQAGGGVMRSRCDGILLNHHDRKQLNK